MPNPERSTFFLVGGHPALDFLNTVAAPRGEPVELLRDGRALLEWLVAVHAIDAEDVRVLRRHVAVATLDAARDRAVVLREWWRPIVARSAAAGTARLTPTELRELNARLAGGARRTEIVPTSSGYEVRRRIRWTSADALLTPIADAIADALASLDFTLVRPCGSSTCTLWFLDRTTGRRRQWCSMAVCGNRAKVAAHRRRARRA